MKAVGEILKEHRVVKSLSQDQVAKSLGFTNQFYGRVERGQVTLPLERASGAIKTLGIKKTELINAYLYDYSVKLTSALN